MLKTGSKSIRVKMNNSPIAVLDSGFGGLSVWREIIKVLPHESIMYYGDGKNCPYGVKPKEEIERIVDEAVRFLLGKGAKMVVLACNAATADAIDHLRATYDVPFVGMEPATKPAAADSKSGIIGILATQATLNGRLFLKTAERYAKNVKLLSAVGEEFVELVEAGVERGELARKAVERALLPMIEAGADHIVLGCTHYPFLTDMMLEVIGERDVKLVDPAPAVARRVKQLLKDSDALSYGAADPVYEFYSANDQFYVERLRLKSEEVRYKE